MSTQGYVTLDSIIRSACEERDDLSLKKYRKYEMWALESLQEMRIDVAQEIKTTSYTIDQYTLSVPFPKDMAKWTKIGHKEGDRIKVFTVNNRLILTNDTDDCGLPVKNAKYVPNYSILGFDQNSGIDEADSNGFWLNNWGTYADTSGAIYGFGAGVQGDGQFRIDSANRRFVFDSRYANKLIYIEYVTNGINPSGGSLVDEVIERAIKYYILWRDCENDPNRGLGEKQRAEDQYRNQERLAYRRTSDLTWDKIIQIFRSGVMQTPKN